MRFVAVELPARHDRSDEQFARLERVLAAEGALDDAVVVLPELAFCGYVSALGDFDRTPVAEPVDGPTVMRAASLARRHRAAMLVPFVERDGARCFNATVLLDRDGAPQMLYRKRHPWIPERWATPGDLGPGAVVFEGVRICVAVCFDVHTLAIDAAVELAAADVLLFQSAWVDDDPAVRPALLRGLRDLFGCAVVNANWGHGVPSVAGQGASLALAGRSGASVRRRDVAGVPVVEAVVPAPPLPPRGERAKDAGA